MIRSLGGTSSNSSIWSVFQQASVLISLAVSILGSCPVFPKFIDENGQPTDRKGAAAILRTVTGATKLIDQGPVVNPAYPIELKVKAIRSSEAWRRSVDVARRDRVFVSFERVVAW